MKAIHSRQKFSRVLRSLGLVAMVAASAVPANAGITDSPLPTLGGASSLHLWSVTGVMTARGLGTIFSCTNPGSSSVMVSVELFVDAGGSPCNDASSVAQSVAPGETVTFATQTTADSSFPNASPLSAAPMYLDGGSARVVSTGKGVICDAKVVDVYNSPPLSMSALRVVPRGKMKGD